MIYYYELDRKYNNKYIEHILGEEQLPNNKCFTIDESGDSFKANVYCDKEHALKPNTIVYSISSDSVDGYWWVVQEDKSTLIDNGLYLHELQLIGAIEWFKFKFCYTGTFYYHRYSYFEVMQKLLYSLWKTNCFDFDLTNFTEKYGDSKINQKFSFKGYTIRNSLKEIEKALNVDFKLIFITKTQTAYGTTVTYISSAKFDIIDKNVYSTNPKDISLLNEKMQISQFPNKSYGSRIIGRASSVSVSNSIIYPKIGCAIIVPDDNTFTISSTNQSIVLPYNIDTIDYIEILGYIGYTENGEVIVPSNIDVSLGRKAFVYLQQQYNGISESVAEKIYDKAITNNKIYNSDDKNDKVFVINGTNSKFKLKDKFYYDSLSEEDKLYCMWYEKGKNVIHNFGKLSSSTIEILFDDGSVITHYYPDKNFIRVVYKPLVDEMLITKNNDQSNDDVIYNQTGQNVDSYLTKDFINGYGESISGRILTKAKFHEKESDIYKVGDVFIKDNERYIVSSVSIDKSKDIYYCEYKLSKDYISKTEYISADGVIESYAIPQNNIVKRIQEYKDFIQFSDNDPSIPNSKYFINYEYYMNFLSDSRNDFSMFVKATSTNGKEYNSFNDNSNEYYFKLSGVEVETNKSTSILYNCYDNNYVGFISTKASDGNYMVTTPYNYVDSIGEFGKIEFLLSNRLYTSTLNIDSSPLLTKTEYDFMSDNSTNIRHHMKLVDNYYKKDAYEIPVFQYTREYNNANGYVFGENISTECGEFGGFLKLYTSSTYIYNEIIDFSTLDYIFNVTLENDNDNGSLTLNKKKIYNVTDPSIIHQIKFIGKNIVVSRCKYNDKSKNTYTEEFLFARNNYDREFYYGLIYGGNIWPEGAIDGYIETYKWTIYLETYKI